jgi:ATP-dependent Lhr-like helicase
MPAPHAPADVLALFRPAVRAWFEAVFLGPTPPQALGWPAIARGESTLVLAPTGTGKTLAAFLVALDRLLFAPVPARERRCRIVYVSPLKALAVDVERNLRAPLAGIARTAAQRGEAHAIPTIAIRTGDTPARERARFQREAADILITTPESLYLLLTSQSRERLRAVDTVIVDEIHALVPTKRGAHLALSLERLAALAGRRLQRIGLSATQRPLEEVARFLGGMEEASAEAAGAVVANASAAESIHEALGEGDRAPLRHRPVTIVDAGARKALELRIEVPVEDMARLAETEGAPGGTPSPSSPSIWTAIHPRLLARIRAHRSTLVFVNSRRLAERLAAALNDLAGETLVYAHHGSLAREQRLEIEDRLKAGRIRALVATSSLELGIDMGAIDLVVQIESPPSVASALQRIGRGGHEVGAVSRGVLFPKYRADLVACAALAEAMREAAVEPTRMPRNPLDVLAQQIVAIVAMDPMPVDALYALVRRAAPFAGLSRATFESVLDMLSGRFASDDFAALRPRLTWDRIAGTVSAREGAKRVAVTSGGTIPDRGLYAVTLAGVEGPQARVGELDEEMVFESRVGETFLLGASSWRIEEITHDRVVVSPAPGAPGKMPFWRGDGAGRSVDLGRRIGALVRALGDLPRGAAIDRLEREHDLDRVAAENLVQYLEDERAATGAVPDDRTLVIERVRDELGDWRVCVLSPLGGRVLAPWSMAVIAKVRRETGLVVEAMWTNDGFVVRFPETESPPDPALLVPSADEVERLVLEQLGSTSLFAARFREIAARALLLPRRRPGKRAPLWQQRKRASDLLQVAAQLPSFPMILETYRECLRESFDLPALRSLLNDVETRAMRVATVDPPAPSPFASAILFGFVANYLYDGDAPLAERRAQALAIDAAQLRELLGEAELRELLDAGVLAEVERELQHLPEAWRARSPDALHDLLLRLGDLSAEEARARCANEATFRALAQLVSARRAIRIVVAGEERFVAVEHASRYRDALGAALPPGLPQSLLAPAADALGDLALRYARTHAPFTAAELAARFALPSGTAEAVLHRLVLAGKLVLGAFRPAGTHREWCDPDVLQRLRRRSLAKLRREVEPVEPPVLARFAATWHGVTRRARGLDALLDAIERLQGAPLVASSFESEVLAARIEGYDPADLDALAAAGEVTWCGVEPLGERDGRIALYLADALPVLRRAPAAPPALSPLEARLVDALARGGASFFGPLHAAAGGGFPRDVASALWDLVWKGIVTNDGFRALRAAVRPLSARDRRRRVPSGPRAGRAYRSRRALPADAEGRWSLLPDRGAAPSDTAWGHALAQQVLARHGIVTREVAAAEGVPGGFSALYAVLQALEAKGAVRRGYFVSGVGAVQFALPAALDALRRLRTAPEAPEALVLAASDPASPYGAILRWPEPRGAEDRAAAPRRPMRAAGASVVLVDGALAAWIPRGGRALLTWLPPDELDAARVGAALARALALHARGRGFLLAEIDGAPARRHPLALALVDAGFVASPQGFHLRADGEPAPGHSFV